MDTGKLKSLATGARVQLMDGVRASLKRVLAPDSTEAINERGHVEELRKEAKDEDALVERVAYTWFNRLCALRLMDSRGYTPAPVVTPRGGETMPAILADARRGTFCADFPLKNADKQRVVALLSGNTDSVNPLGEAYVILLLSACDYYAKPIPALFGADPRSANAMRLLAPSSLPAENSVLQRIVDGMDDENCSQVEVMGWLYQFYIEEKRVAINAGFKARGKDKIVAGPKEIAPATQIFTPEWIVRYLVENSLGRLWMLNYPDSELAARMIYYIAPTEPETDYLRIDSPEDITFLDPAMGSGHILIYAFDLLYDMYIEEGYRPAEIPALILQKNLTGFEIDDRAAEIATFALIIKACEHDAEFFEHATQPDITVFHSVQFDNYELQDAGLISGYGKLLEALSHLDEVGSLYRPEPPDVILLENASVNLAKQNGLFVGHALSNIEVAANIMKQLDRRFSVVVANPPYLGGGNMNAWLNGWIRENNPDEKGDLCTCFITRDLQFTKEHGYTAIIVSDSCMYISSYTELRNKLIQHKSIISLIDTRGTNAHPDVFDANAGFVFHNCRQPAGRLGYYFKLAQRIDLKEESFLHAITTTGDPVVYRADTRKFLDIPGCPLAYWVSKIAIDAFKIGKPIGDGFDAVVKGIFTGDNNRFLRLWHEVSACDVGTNWRLYLKGGDFRRWYGNINFVVDWHDGAYELNHFGGSGMGPSRYFGHETITWSKISSGIPHFRFNAANCAFDDASPAFVLPGASMQEHAYYTLGFLNSSVTTFYLGFLAPTLNFQCGEMKKLPLLLEDVSHVASLVKTNIGLSKQDWDLFEMSWEFIRHPLVHNGSLIDAAGSLKSEMYQRWSKVKTTEEELNRIFASIYGLEDEVPIEVPDEKVSIRKFNREREIKSLISYAIGCMFGRYSLDKDGLILADQGSTIEDYLAKVPSPTFMPDEDGILPITEEEWFEDDIVTEFWRWLKAAFGEEHFDENLAYIEETLGCKLREYFIKGKKSAFYDDHCKTYSVTGSGKRPIYWMFSSPKSSFNCLVYLHRYDDRTVSKILTDYVRELRRKLEVQARSLEASDIARDRTRAAKYHDMIDELNDWERDVLYPMAQRHIKIDLDDGVRHNYKLFPGALRKVTGLS